MGMILTCEEATRFMSDFQDGILPLGQFLKVRMHLFNCPACRTLLATLRALPALAANALAPTDPGDCQARGQVILASAMARMGQPGYQRAWAATPVPQEAQRVLESAPDLPMRLLACTHDLIARDRAPLPPPYRLPQATLDQLPAAERWIWQERRGGGRRADLVGDQGGVRLLLVYAPPNTALPPHRHLGSESILVLDGGLDDQGRDYACGDWVHHPDGSCHAPRVAPSGCWCLIREEGSVRFLGPAAWLRHLRDAS